MTELKQIYKCSVCGNIVEVLHTGAGELVCCGQSMELMEPNTVDAAQEKHVPVIEKNKDIITVKIGAQSHPMTYDHHINWIELIYDGESCKQILKPGDHPEATFRANADHLEARAYCNLHGLWKT